MVWGFSVLLIGGLPRGMQWNGQKTGEKQKEEEEWWMVSAPVEKNDKEIEGWGSGDWWQREEQRSGSGWNYNQEEQGIKGGKKQREGGEL